MKKILIAISTILCITLFASACGLTNKKDPNTLTIGASTTPHAEILEFAKSDFEALGYKLEIIIYTDYIMPNRSLAGGDLDANYFQHTSYLNDYNTKNNTNLISAGAIHYEPMAIFGKNVSDIANIPTNAKIILPADASNQARALFLLAENGIIEIDVNANVNNLTVLDVLNAKGHTLYPVEAASIPAQLKQSDNGTIAVINGNYALSANLSLSTALAIEKAESEGVAIYANIIAIKEEDKTNELILALIKILTSEKVKTYIRDNYSGAVLPV